MFPYSIAEWTIPSVTGDIPPPMYGFLFTKISSVKAVMFGGRSPGYESGNLYPATVGRDSVVGVNWWWLSVD